MIPSLADAEIIHTKDLPGRVDMVLVRLIKGTIMIRYPHEAVVEGFVDIGVQPRFQ